MLELTQKRYFWAHLYSRAFRLKKLNATDVNESPPSSPHHLGRVQDGGSGPHFHHLKRSLGMGQLVLMGVGGSIGAGIFVLTGVAAIDTGPAVVLSYLFAGFISVLDALCYAELASRYPLAGSVYLYTSLSLGEFPALLISINLLFDYHIAAALISRSFATYLIRLLQTVGVHVPAWVAAYSVNRFISFNFIAPALLACLTAVLCGGASHGARLNMVLTLAKVAVVLLVICIGAMHVRVQNWAPFFPAGIGQVFSTSATVFFSYVGFDTIAASSEEVRNPRRDLPVAILASLGICSLLYMAVCLIITGMQPYHKIDPSAPLTSAFQHLGLTWIEGVISFGGVVGLATTLLIGLFAQARVYLSIARDGLIPSALADINPWHKTPVKAQLWCGAVAMALSAFFNVKLLAELLDMGVILAYGTVCASVLVLRSPNRVHTVRHLGLLVLTFTLPCLLTKQLGVGWWCVLFVLPLLSLFPLVHQQRYPAPPSAFACPLVPALPLAGVLLNVYLSLNLSLYAWLRLLVLWSLLSLYYVYSEAQAVGPHFGSECLSRHGQNGYPEEEDCVGSSALRHRRSAGGTGHSMHRPLVSLHGDVESIDV